MKQVKKEGKERTRMRRIKKEGIELQQTKKEGTVMKEIKKLAACVLAAALVLVLAACGASGSDFQTSESKPGGSAMDMEDFSGWNSGASFDAAADGSYVESDMPDMPMPQAPSSSAVSSRPENTKIIYTADLSLETTSFENAAQALEHVVTGLGGWFESRAVDQGGSYRSLNCTIRVPAENFIALLDQAGQTAHQTYRQEYQTDVSESYYDSEARLTTQRTKLERLQALLAQAQNMEDIITLESAISDTELQIEYLTGSLRHYDSLVDYATVTLSLREVYRLSGDEEPAVTFGQRLSAAFSDGFRQTVENLEDLAVFLARNWVGLLTLAVFAAAAVCVVVRVEKRSRQRRNRQMPPPPPSTEK